MRIVFNTYFREKMGGGIGQVAYEIAPAFAKNHQVLFIVPGRKNQVKKQKILTLLEIKSVGEDQIVLPKLDFKTVKYIFGVLKEFRPEVVHCHDPGPVAFLLQIWAIKNSVPFIYTSHVLSTKFVDFGSKDASEKLSKFLDKILLNKYLLLFLENCDAVISLNKSSEKDIREFGHKGKIFEVPNGRNLNLYNKMVLAKLSDKKIKLIFIGYLSDRKNQLFLLKAMKHLPPNFELDLIGSPLQEQYGEMVRRFAQINKLNVNFTGKVDHQEIPKYLQKAHFFVSASKMEVQSLVVMEAMASGTPVIGLANETIDQLIDEGSGCRLPKAATPREFARKIIEYSRLPQNEYEKLCANARKKMAGYDWEEVREKTISVYEEVIESKNQNQQVKKERVTTFLNELAKKIKFPQNHKKEVVVISGFSKKDFSILFVVFASLIANSWYSLSSKLKNLKSKFEVIDNF